MPPALATLEELAIAEKVWLGEELTPDEQSYLDAAAGIDPEWDELVDWSLPGP